MSIKSLVELAALSIIMTFNAAAIIELQHTKETPQWFIVPAGGIVALVGWYLRRSTKCTENCNTEVDKEEE